MKIKIYSLNDANKVNGGNWISIRDKGFEEFYKHIDETADDVLVLTFDDIHPYHVKHDMIHDFYKNAISKREPIYFNEDMANDIYDFVKNKDSINIHCFAGISRSQAVGHIINIFFNALPGNKVDFINSIQKFSVMNPLVLNIMENVFKERSINEQ